MIQELKKSEYISLATYGNSMIPCWFENEKRFMFDSATCISKPMSEPTIVLKGRSIDSPGEMISTRFLNTKCVKTGLYLGYFINDNYIKAFYFDKDKGFFKVVAIKNNKPVIRYYSTPDYIIPFRYYLLGGDIIEI